MSTVAPEHPEGKKETSVDNYFIDTTKRNPPNLKFNLTERSAYPHV